MSAAQDALREDPQNENARKILENAQSGQKALVQLKAAEAALARGDFAAAESELEAARRLAPWDRGVAELSSRIGEARARAQRDTDTKAQSAKTAQVTDYLNQANAAMGAKQYEAAIAFYNRILEMDPNNQAALIGKTGAIGAKSQSDAAASGARPGGAVHSFVPGRTEAKGTEQGGLVGFEDSAGVDVKKGTQAAELPGKIVFEASPASPKPGERFKVSVFLSNEGSQADPARHDDRGHHTRREAAERSRSPLRDDGGARPARSRLPDAGRAGLEGGHAVLDDGDRPPHRQGRDLPQRPLLEVASRARGSGAGPPVR